LVFFENNIPTVEIKTAAITFGCAIAINNPAGMWHLPHALKVQ
jgi:hypothetical protein